MGRGVRASVPSVRRHTTPMRRPGADVVGALHEPRNLVRRPKGCQRQTSKKKTVAASSRVPRPPPGRGVSPPGRGLGGSQGFRQVRQSGGPDRRIAGEGQPGRWSGKRDSNPRPSAWKADALAAELFPLKRRRDLWMVEGEGFEPSKASAGRFTVCSLWPLGHPSTPARASARGRRNAGPLAGGPPGPARGLVPASDDRAGEGTRTPNHLITNEMLYQLSYASTSPKARKSTREDSQGPLHCQALQRPGAGRRGRAGLSGRAAR